MNTEQAKPRPMSEAPRDGTVVLAFVEGRAQPHFISWHRKTKERGSWILDHSNYWRYHDDEFLGWIPCPTYTGEAVK